MKWTMSEIIIAVVLSTAVAAIAATVGFVGAVLLCAKFLRGEAGEAGLVLGPVMALVFAVVAFVICFWKIITYGQSSNVV